MAEQTLAEVTLWGKQVGALSYDQDTRLGAFEYAPSWIRQGIEIAPIHMPLASNRIFQFNALPYETYKGLPAVFADTLPDDFGNAVINAWLAREGRSADQFNALHRLLYTGNRGMGALEYKPVIKSTTQSSQVIELESLVTMAQQVLDQRGQFRSDLTDTNPHALNDLLMVGTSAGGARAKAVIAINQDRTRIHSGQTDAPAGFEHYLLKFDGVTEQKVQSELFGDPQGFGRMEYAYYQMAQACGINMSHCELLHDGPRAHFITQRFDRIHNQKLHYVSLCAMDHADFKQPGSYSYEQLFALMRSLRLQRNDAIQIIRRMVFNVIARNQDDHTKNFGFLLAPPQPDQTPQWQLAPAFDIAYSYKPDSPWVSLHQMSINGKRDQFDREDLIAAAPERLRKETVTAIERTLDVVSQWPRYAKDNGVFATLTEEIQRHIRLAL